MLYRTQSLTVLLLFLLSGQQISAITELQRCDTLPAADSI